MSLASWWRRTLTVAGTVVLTVTVSAASDPAAQALREQAESHERHGDWDKALDAYSELLRRDHAAETQQRYFHCLRRYYQILRHQDASYRKEVLSLDYGQSLRLYSRIRDTLLDFALDKKRVTPARLFEQGLNELDAALANPQFIQQHLPGRQLEAAAFRDYLKKKYPPRDRLNRGQVETQIREIALAAQDILQLNPTVTIMELACGSGYAVDNYTAYLTPDQLRELVDALKGETASGMMVASVAFANDSKAPEIGYLRILSFQESTLQELDDALDKLVKSEIKALILDLRGNPGGIVEVAIEAAKRFLSEGIIATVESQDPKYSTVYYAREPAPFALPMSVLIDSDTASAAEVLAGALKENDRARIVGQ
ncbi:MAG: S41 family peptidase, partial [Gemmataceae bacterium]|nr:S41 family peptidase [Gemmataceae bacterium]